MCIGNKSAILLERWQIILVARERCEPPVCLELISRDYFISDTLVVAKNLASRQRSMCG
jgi:hypothetical protein